MPARSTHRSSFESPPPGPGDDERDLFAREAQRRQSSLAYRRRLAETRKAEADARRADIEVLEAEGRLRRQPLEEQEIKARINREEAATGRDLVYTVVPLVMLALLYILGAVSGAAGGFELVRDNSWVFQMLGPN
ncbi:MAG TPA: hypothetical protein VFS35_05695 [Terrimicrobiaceae bacterium]|nr:hypothetical protein [Terrimicrobiaceae bacterium]